MALVELQAIGQMAGNAMHCRAVGAALALILEARPIKCIRLECKMIDVFMVDLKTAMIYSSVSQLAG